MKEQSDFRPIIYNRGSDFNIVKHDLETGYSAEELEFNETYIAIRRSKGKQKSVEVQKPSSIITAPQPKPSYQPPLPPQLQPPPQTPPPPLQTPQPYQPTPNQYQYMPYQTPTMGYTPTIQPITCPYCNSIVQFYPEKNAYWCFKCQQFIY